MVVVSVAIEIKNKQRLKWLHTEVTNQPVAKTNNSSRQTSLSLSLSLSLLTRAVNYQFVDLDSNLDKIMNDGSTRLFLTDEVVTIMILIVMKLTL